MTPFSRYSRQMALPDVGLSGQQKLSQASVLIIGAGGLGTPLAAYLGASGIGHIGIADGDFVDEINLHRQFLFSPENTGNLKVEILAEAVRKQNPAINVTTHPVFLDEENAIAIISNYNLVCDCTDTIQSRKLVDRCCQKLQKPLVYAAVGGWEGYVTVLHGAFRITLSDVFTLNSDLASCSLSGIIPATCGIAASIQAAEAIKVVLGITSLDGKVLCFDSREMVFRAFKLLLRPLS